MKKFLLIQIFALFMNLYFLNKATAQSGWTKETQTAIYNQLYNSVKLNFSNDSIKKVFSLCVIQKLKSSLPGGPASISTDSLNKLANKIGIDCKKELNTTILTQWSTEFEKALRQNLYDILKKTLTENLKNMICDCMVEQYKKIYPQGMPKEIPLDVENKVLGVCYVKIINNK